MTTSRVGGSQGAGVPCPRVAKKCMAQPESPKPSAPAPTPTTAEGQIRSLAATGDVSLKAVDWVIRGDTMTFSQTEDRDIRIIKMDIEGAEWDLMNRLIDHPVLNRIDCIFVETHERIDPAKYVPMFDALQDRAEQLTRPYINLYWI